MEKFFLSQSSQGAQSENPLHNTPQNSNSPLCGLEAGERKAFVFAAPTGCAPYHRNNLKRLHSAPRFTEPSGSKPWRGTGRSCVAGQAGAGRFLLIQDQF